MHSCKHSIHDQKPYIYPLSNPGFFSIHLRFNGCFSITQLLTGSLFLSQQCLFYVFTLARCLGNLIKQTSSRYAFVSKKFHSKYREVLTLLDQKLNISTILLLAALNIDCLLFWVDEFIRDRANSVYFSVLNFFEGEGS